MKLRAIGKLISLALLALLISLVILIIRDLTTSTSPIPSYASAFICSSPSDTRSCVSVEGKTVATDTDSQITRFLASVWMKNSNSDSPILGAFDLQRCENSGISAGKVECVFFSNATRHDEAVLNHIFRTSRLFVTVTDTRI